MQLYNTGNMNITCVITYYNSQYYIEGSIKISYELRDTGIEYINLIINILFFFIFKMFF